MRFTIRARLIGIVGLLCILLAITTGWGIIGLRAADQRAISTYRTELLPLQHSAKLYRLTQLQSATLFETLRYWTDSDEVSQRMQQIDTYRKQIVAEQQAYQATSIVSGSAALRQNFLNDLAKYQVALRDAGSLLASGNPSGALVIIETRLRSGSLALQKDIDALDNLMRQQAEANYSASSNAFNTMRNSMLGILAAGIFIALISGDCLFAL